MSTRGLFRRCRQQMPLGAVRNGAAAGGSRGRLCSPPGRGRPPGARGGSARDTRGVTARPPEHVEGQSRTHAGSAPGPPEPLEGQRGTRAGSQPKARGVFIPLISGDPQTGSPGGVRPWLLPSQGQDRAPTAPPLLWFPLLLSLMGLGGAINSELSPPPPAPLSHGEPGFGGGDSCQAEGTNAGCPA